MPPISFGGINTGLPPNLVEQIIDGERMSIRVLESRKKNDESRLALVSDLEANVGKIRGSISELANTKGFSDVQLLSGDPNIVQGVVDPELAQPGSWNVEVMELAQKPSAITNGFPDKDRTEIGVGYFSFDTPDGKKEVYINGENNTLDGVVKAINRSDIGMRASVIKDSADADFPYRLVIAGKAVGDENQISFPSLYFLDGDQDIYFQEEREAKNGRVKIDGFELEIAENQISDYIPGVTIELKQAVPGKTVNLTVKENLEVVSGKIKEFVESVNGVLRFVQSQNKLDAKSDTKSTLGGDGLLRTVESRIRQLVQSPVYGVKGSVTSLNQLGIQFTREGTLNFDQEKFNSVLAKNPVDVQSFFVGNGYSVGFIPQLRNTISNLLNPSFGPITNRKKGIQQKLDTMDQRIAKKEDQLAKRETTLRQKFARLEETMSRLKSQGAAVQAVGASGFGGVQLNQG
jgi:flagellar hook-associated protein 2